MTSWCVNEQLTEGRVCSRVLVRDVRGSTAVKSFGRASFPKIILTYIANPYCRFAVARFKLPWFSRGGSLSMAAPGFLDSISPWGTRSTTPKPSPSKADTNPRVFLSKQQGADHAVIRRPRLTQRDYPEDCPKLTVKWFYAVDVRRLTSSFKVYQI